MNDSGSVAYGSSLFLRRRRCQLSLQQARVADRVWCAKRQQAIRPGHSSERFRARRLSHVSERGILCGWRYVSVFAGVRRADGAHRTADWLTAGQCKCCPLLNGRSAKESRLRRLPRYSLRKQFRSLAYPAMQRGKVMTPSAVLGQWTPTRWLRTGSVRHRTHSSRLRPPQR